MKKTNIVTAAFVLFAGVSLTSCSTSIDIAQRHFNSGYYVHVNHQAKNTVTAKQNVTVAPVNHADITPVVAQNSSVPVAKPEVIAIENSFSSSVENKQPAAAKKKHRDVVVPSEVSNSENNSFSSPVNKHMQKRFNRASNHLMRGDAPGIVMVLLCIFLPPVAVGIVDDWGSKFWIDLLLTLLFYFPGMIYAFIVCF